MIRFLLIGKYSTGKSSFLNNIIGYNLNLLQTSISECTKFALIIKYTKSKEDICLIEAEKVIHSEKVFIKEKNNGEYIIGEENIKNRITQLNNTNELKYYILKTPIQILDEYNYDDEIKEKIEFLDFPGLYTSSDVENNVLNNASDLLKSIDGFILFHKGIFDSDIIQLIKKIINLVTCRNPQFSFKTCLFILTFIDEKQVNLSTNQEYNNEKSDIIIMKETLIKTFTEAQKLTFDKRDWENEETFDELHVTSFSNKFYKQYINFFLKIFFKIFNY